MDEKGKNKALLKWILPIFILTLSFTLRLIRLNMGLWYDEIFSLQNFFRADLREVLLKMPDPNHHLLYTLLAKICINLFGEKEWSLRLPSLIIGGFTPFLWYLFLRKFVDEVSSFASGILLSLSMWMVWFSQDARGYAGMILFSSLSSIWFLRLLQKPITRNTVFLYFVFSVLSSLFHLYGGFTILGQAIVGATIWLIRRDREARNGSVYATIGGIISLVFYLPMFSDMLYYAQTEAHKTLSRSLNFDFLKALPSFWLGTQNSFWSGWFGFALFTAGLVQILKKNLILATLFLLPLFLVLIFTKAFGFFVYNRFFSFFIPFYLLSVASGTIWISETLKYKKILLPLLFCSIIALMTPSLYDYYRFGKQGFKDASQWLSKNSPDSCVISLGISENEFRYYYPTAIPIGMDVPLNPEEAKNCLIITSHPWSWGKFNYNFIMTRCKVLKKWKSAGYEQNDVLLLKCY